MTWSADLPQSYESRKVRYRVVPYIRGRGLDLGCGAEKVLPHVIGVDNLHHAHEFDWPIKPDVRVDTAEDLKIFGTESLDFVFSAHLLEHLEKAPDALKEWWRVIKPGGYLVLYLPSDQLYPKMGEKDANPDHKWDLNQELVVDWMQAVGSWDLVVNELRGEGNEYSFLQVYEKLADD